MSIRKGFKKLFFLMLAVALSGLFVTARAVEASDTVVYTDYDVTEFGADGSDTADDTSAIQTVLNKSITADDTVGIRVTIPAGTYYISSALLVYPNTDLILSDETVIVRTDDSVQMLIGSHCTDEGKVCSGGEDCTHTGYTQCHNVTIQGGTWDGNVQDTSAYYSPIFGFAHADGITVKDTTLTNCCGMHMINCDGIANSTFQNIVFQNMIPYTGTDSYYYTGEKEGTFSQDQIDYTTFWGKEALHLDYIRTDGDIGVYPAEDLACENITVTGCTFENVLSGIGCHFIGATIESSGIVITDNEFVNINNNCINLPHWVDVEVSNNTVENAGIFFYSYGTEGTISGNSVSGISDHGIICQFDSDLEIVNNTLAFDTDSEHLDYGIAVHDATVELQNNSIYDAGSEGVRINTGSEVTATGNTIERSLSDGISVTESAVSLSGNTVTDAGGNGIYLGSAVGTAVLSGNKITNAAACGIAMSATTATLTDNVVSGCETIGINVQNSALVSDGDQISDVQEGISLSASEGQISNCQVSSTTGNAITAKLDSTLAASDITITDAGTYGIYVVDCTGSCVVENGVIQSPLSSGIYLSGVQEATITGMSILDASEMGIMLNLCGAVTVNDCEVSDAVQHSIYAKNTPVTVSGCTIDDSGSDAINLSSCDDSQVTNNTISNAAQNGIYCSSCTDIQVVGNKIDTAGSTGIACRVGTTGTVDDNTISNITKMGITVFTESSVDITNNTLDTITQAGIYVNAGTADIADNTISNTSVGTTSYSAINVSGETSYAAISGNTILNPNGNGVAVNSAMDANSISNNTVDGAGKNGIYVSATTAVVVENNLVENSGSIGIQMNQAPEFTVSLNHVMTSQSHGIYISSCEVGTVEQNQVNDNSGIGIAASASTDLLIDNNLVYNNASKEINVYNSSTGILSNNRYGTAGLSVGSNCTFEQTNNTLYTGGETIDITTLESEISLEATVLTYTGSELTPKVTVSGLIEDQDYTVSYENNVEIGTATVVITGIDSYDGVVTKTFSICPNAPTVTTWATNTTVTLKWDEVSEAEKYRIFSYDADENTLTQIASVTDLTYTITGLNAGTTYQYLVRSVSGTVLSPYTLPDSLVSVTTTEGLDAPTVTAKATTTTVTLSWEAVEDAEKYRVYSYDADNKKFTQLTSTTSLSYTITGLEKGTTYQYLVRAVQGTTLSAYSVPDSLISVTTAEGLNAPTVTAKATTTTVTLSWEAVEDAEKYRVYSYDADNKKFTQLTSTTSLSYTITGLEKGTTYQYLVRAVQGTTLSAYSVPDSLVIVTTTAGLDAPTVTAKATGTTVTLSWEAVEDAEKYRVYSYDADTEKFTQLMSANVLSYTITDLEEGATYQYLVRAVQGTTLSAYTVPDDLITVTIDNSTSVSAAAVSSLAEETTEAEQESAETMQDVMVDESSEADDTTLENDNE